MRIGIRAALRSLGTATEQEIQNLLAKQFELGHSGRLQFEIDPIFYGIHLVQTEELVVPGDVVLDVIAIDFLERAELAGLDWIAPMREEVIRWFADRWQAVDGPLRYRPAYAFFHGGLDEPRFDLEQRRWCQISEVWPEEP